MILFDLDEVNFEFFSVFGQEVKKRGLPGLDTKHPDCYGMGLERFAEVLDDAAMDGFFAGLPVIGRTLELVREVASMQLLMGYLTARNGMTGRVGVHEKIVKDTVLSMLRYDFPHIGNLSFAKGVKKVDLVLAMRATMILEDHPETCVDLSRLTTHEGKPFKAILLSREHNLDFDYSPRITDPMEFLQFI
jgi:hypothetical protein